MSQIHKNDIQQRLKWESDFYKGTGEVVSAKYAHVWSPKYLSMSQAWSVQQPPKNSTNYINYESHHHFQLTLS